MVRPIGPAPAPPGQIEYVEIPSVAIQYLHDADRLSKPGGIKFWLMDRPTFEEAFRLKDWACQPLVSVEENLGVKRFRLGGYCIVIADSPPRLVRWPPNRYAAYERMLSWGVIPGQLLRELDPPGSHCEIIIPHSPLEPGDQIVRWTKRTGAADQPTTHIETDGAAVRQSRVPSETVLPLAGFPWFEFLPWLGYLVGVGSWVIARFLA